MSEREDSHLTTHRRVGVLIGGRSSEREVSLSSGRQVFYNLDPEKYEPVALYMDLGGGLWRMPEKLVIQNTCPDIDARLADEAERVRYADLPELVDVMFITLHGKYGDDGCIQGALELMDIPYTGSGVLAAGLSLDKPRVHSLLAEQGFEVPREIVVDEADWRQIPEEVTERVATEVGYPVVVLPAREGSSVGVTFVTEAHELADALESAFRWDARALVEENLSGLEFSIIVLGNEEPEPLLPTEVTTTNPVMTYEDKYMPGRSQKITPARVEAAEIQRLQETAAEVYRCIGFRGYARLDGFLTDDGRTVFNDPNSTSGMAPSSFMFHQAAEAGLTPMALVDRILELAFEAHSSKRGPL